MKMGELKLLYSVLTILFMFGFFGMLLFGMFRPDIKVFIISSLFFIGWRFMLNGRKMLD